MAFFKVNKIKHYKGKIMGTQVFLGNPPQHVIDWIHEHSKLVVSPKTKITFTDGSKGEYLIEGAMDCPALVAAG